MTWTSARNRGIYQAVQAYPCESSKLSALAFCHVMLWSCHLEVIDIDCKDARASIQDGRTLTAGKREVKPNRFQHLFAMLLPKASTIRVTIQSKDKLHFWITELTMPTFRPAHFGQCYPSLCAFEPSLRIGLFAIGLFAHVAWHVPVGINVSCRLPSLPS